jgi:hypothetical protein
MLRRLQALTDRLSGPGARAVVGTLLIVAGLHQLVTFTQDVGAALAQRADELATLDAMVMANRDVLLRAGVFPPIPPEVDLDVSRETSQDHGGVPDPHADVFAE